MAARPPHPDQLHLLTDHRGRRGFPHGAAAAPETSTGSSETTTADLGPATVENQPFAFPPVTVEPAPQEYRSVLASAGASHPRDAIDTRLIDDVVHQTGAIISDPESVGGFGTLRGGTPPPDGDRDGMPDTWERGHGLNPADPSDAKATDATGYTHVETYLNELATDHER